MNGGKLVCAVPQLKIIDTFLNKSDYMQMAFKNKLQTQGMKTLQYVSIPHTCFSLHLHPFLEFAIIILIIIIAILQVK